jgi:uncharacterized membrane protein
MVEHVTTSLWALPLLMMVVGCAAAPLILTADVPADGPGTGLKRFIFVGTADEARDLVSTLLAGMVTMTSLVFSITIVVLTLAATQFGPRLVRSFMANWMTQFVLGTFVLTISFCLILLFEAGARAGDELMQMPSITSAIGLCLASVALLVLFLHHLARSIVSETLIERVGRELDEQFQRLPPLEVAKGAPGQPDLLQAEQEFAFFGIGKPGYVEAIEFERLLDLAIEKDLTILLRFRPGDYLAANGNTIAVRPHASVTATVQHEVVTAIVTGHRRTPAQDPEFSIRHLVEIAIRALSPGINDPYTAAAVVDRLSGSLALAVTHSLPVHSFVDSTGRIRVASAQPTWESLIGSAFNQIRQSGAAKPLVVIHLIDAVARIAEHLKLPEQVAVLREQLDAVLADARHELHQALDLNEIKSRHAAAAEALRKVCH